MIFGGGNWELCPFVEDGGGGGAGTALHLGFYAPGEGGAVIAVEHLVCALRVEVFGVEEEAVHVEEAGADGWESGGD